jgi:hypothetical protein
VAILRVLEHALEQVVREHAVPVARALVRAMVPDPRPLPPTTLGTAVVPQCPAKIQDGARLRTCVLERGHVAAGLAHCDSEVLWL